jgi:hypothetical protein
MIIIFQDIDETTIFLKYCILHHVDVTIQQGKVYLMDDCNENEVMQGFFEYKQTGRKVELMLRDCNKTFKYEATQDFVKRMSPKDT